MTYYAVRWHVEWYVNCLRTCTMVLVHGCVLFDFFCVQTTWEIPHSRHIWQLPHVANADDHVLYKPDFPCTPSTIAALGSLPFGRLLCCGWVSWKEKMKQVWKGIPALQPHLGPEQHLCSWIFFSGIMGMVAIWSLSSILFSKAKLINIAWWSHGAPVAATFCRQV